MFSYKGPVYTVDLGPRVNDRSGVDVFHSKRRNDEFHFNVQGVLSSGGTMNGNGEFLCQSGSPFQKSWLYCSCGVESRPITRSSSSLAISSTEVVVSTTATFLVWGWAGEQAGRGGRFMKVVQDAAICPFCWHRRQCPSLKHLSLSSRVSFLGFSLVSTSMELGSLEGVFLVGVGVWNATGVLDECCLVTKAAKRRWLRNWSIFSYHPLGVVGITSIP